MSFTLLGALLEQRELAKGSSGWLAWQRCEELMGGNLG